MIEIALNLRLNYKNESIDIKQRLVKLLMNSVHEENKRKDRKEENSCNSEYWMSMDYDDRVLDYWRLPNGQYIVRLKQIEGLKCEKDLKNTMPAHLGSFYLTNSERILKKIFT